LQIPGGPVQDLGEICGAPGAQYDKAGAIGQRSSECRTS